MDPVDPDGRNILHLAVSNVEEFLRLFHEAEDKNPRGKYFSKKVKLCPEAQKLCPNKILRIMI